MLMWANSRLYMWTDTNMNNYIFDVDRTLTEPRATIDPDFRKCFIDYVKLEQSNNNRVYLLTGSDKDKTIEQIGTELWELVDGSYQSCGNELYVGGELVKKSEWVMSDALRMSIKNEIRKSVWNGTAENNIEERVGMVNMSTIGRGCTLEEREYYYEWDKQWEERKYIVERLSQQFSDVDFAIGGQISIDIYPKGKDKSQVLDDMEGEVYFVGDSCQEGGNDYAIYSKLDIFHSFWVKDFEETRKLLEASYE